MIRSGPVMRWPSSDRFQADDPVNVQITIHDGPLPPLPPHTSPRDGGGGGAGQALPEGTGAAVIFEGIVRPLEAGSPIAALDYEVYQPMATQILEQLARELIDRHRLLGMWIEHSQGRVPVGACSFRLHIFAAHRKEALAAMDAFIDRMKQEVPIWKTVAS